MNNLRDKIDSLVNAVPFTIFILLSLNTVVVSLLDKPFELSTNTYFLIMLLSLSIYAERIIQILKQKD